MRIHISVTGLMLSSWEGPRLWAQTDKEGPGVTAGLASPWQLINIATRQDREVDSRNTDSLYADKTLYW